MKVTDEMVDRFLSWRLPITAMPDACVMDRSHDRMGTHVLSFTEAKAMLEHVLAGCDESKSCTSEERRTAAWKRGFDFAIAEGYTELRDQRLVAMAWEYCECGPNPDAAEGHKPGGSE